MRAVVLLVLEPWFQYLKSGVIIVTHRIIRIIKIYAEHEIVYIFRIIIIFQILSYVAVFLKELHPESSGFLSHFCVISTRRAAYALGIHRSSSSAFVLQRRKVWQRQTSPQLLLLPEGSLPGSYDKKPWGQRTLIYLIRTTERAEPGPRWVSLLDQSQLWAEMETHFLAHFLNHAQGWWLLNATPASLLSFPNTIASAVATFILRLPGA